MNKFPESELRNFGFSNVKTGFVLTKNYEYLNIILQAEIGNDGQSLNIKAIDPFSSEEYRLHLSPKANGEYVKKVRNAISELKNDIIEHCTDKSLYFDQIKLVKDFIKQKYEVQVEYPWCDKSGSDNAVFRKKENGKWFAVLLKCQKKKISGSGEEYLNVLNVKISTDEKQSPVDNLKIFPAYHMNKKSWVSIVLNHGLDFSVISRLITDSYSRA